MWAVPSARAAPCRQHSAQGPAPVLRRRVALLRPAGITGLQVKAEARQPGATQGDQMELMASSRSKEGAVAG